MLRDVGVAAGSRGDQSGPLVSADQLKALFEKMEELKKKLDDPGPGNQT